MKEIPDLPQDNQIEPAENQEQAAAPPDSTDREQSPGLNRRRFLAAGAGAAAAII
ncbi:MAG: hypothetical protein JO360_16055, partial [Acidobacteria bacterium]|nr:hypothetical protein [Acidobacteriota bacterium]